jgi:hypothetical protein
MFTTCSAVFRVVIRPTVEDQRNHFSIPAKDKRFISSPVSTPSVGATQHNAHKTAYCTNTKNALLITVLHLILNFGLKIISKLLHSNAICNSHHNSHLVNTFAAGYLNTQRLQNAGHSKGPEPLLS